MVLASEEVIELIFSYIAEISSERSLDNVLLLLADLARKLVDADRCTLWLLSKDSQRLWTKVAQGMEPVEIPSDSGLVGYAVQNRQRLIVNDVYADDRFNDSVDRQTGYRTKNMMIIPMYNRAGMLIGAYQVMNKALEQDFIESDMRYIMLASAYTAESIETMMLYEELEETQKEVVHILAEAVESRSEETGNHVRRVAEYSKILALAYGLDEDEAEIVRNASPLHDIGKIAIPDMVLNKPGPFDAKERTIMNAHPERGHRLLKNSARELLKAAAVIAEQHHERWDGKGYPKGLAGEEIHLYGRITAIADVFDALSSDRVYKKAWPDEKTLDLFRQERGKQFDPVLVDLFFRHIDEILSVRDKLKDVFPELP